MTKLPNFLRKTIKYTDARYITKGRRATYYALKQPKIRHNTKVNKLTDHDIDNLKYNLDRKLLSLDVYKSFNEIENGNYSDNMITLIFHALGLKDIIDIKAICNDKSTQYEI